MSETYKQGWIEGYEQGYSDGEYDSDQETEMLMDDYIRALHDSQGARQLAKSMEER
jgi:hypothetical protein